MVRRPHGSMKVEATLPPLRRGLIADIMRWEEWRLLLGRISRTAVGLVEFVDRDDPALKNREADLNDERKTPVKSDDFMRPFLTSLSKLQKALRDRCLEGLKHHSEELKRDLESRLGGPANVSRLQAACSNDGGFKIDPFSGVSETLGSAWIDPYLPEVSSTTEARNKEVNSEYFPLQHGDSKPLKPLYLYYAWHKPLHQKHSHDFDDRHRHMMYVIKLRQVIIDAALAWLDDVAYEVEGAMHQPFWNG